MTVSGSRSKSHRRRHRQRASERQEKHGRQLLVSGPVKPPLGSLSHSECSSRNFSPPPRLV